MFFRISEICVKQQVNGKFSMRAFYYYVGGMQKIAQKKREGNSLRRLLKLEDRLLQEERPLEKMDRWPTVLNHRKTE